MTLAKSARSNNAKVSWVAKHWLGWVFWRRTSRHPLLPGHQVHPGGPRPPGLRTGINTNGKTVRGLERGKMRQHRLRSQEVDLGTRELGARFRTPSRKLSTSTHDRRLNIIFYGLQQLRCPCCWFVVVFFFWISRPGSGNCPERDGGECTQYTWPDAHTRTFFLVERVTCHSCALCVAQDVSGWKKSASSFCAHFHLVPWCRC